MTDSDLVVLKANVDKRVELTCVDGETISGELVMVSSEDVLLDAVRRGDGRESSESVLSIRFTEIASVRPLSQA